MNIYFLILSIPNISATNMKGAGTTRKEKLSNDYINKKMYTFIYKGIFIFPYGAFPTSLPRT